MAEEGLLKAGRKTVKREKEPARVGLNCRKLVVVTTLRNPKQ